MFDFNRHKVKQDKEMRDSQFTNADFFFFSTIKLVSFLQLAFKSL